MAASADQIKLILHPELWDSLIKDQDLVYTSLTDSKIGQVYDEILEDKHALIKYHRDPQVMSVFIKALVKIAKARVVDSIKKELKKELKEEIKKNLLDSVDRQFDEKWTKEVVAKDLTNLRISSRPKKGKKRFDIE